MSSVDDDNDDVSNDDDDMTMMSGCMAERLKTRLLEQDGLVDVVCGPDAYRDLPRLLAVTTTGQAAGITLQQNVNFTQN